VVEGSSYGRERRKGFGFVGSADKEIKELPDIIKQRLGYQLRLVQDGQDPDDFKPMSIVGSGVFEIRVDDEHGNNIGRCFYVAKFANYVYVLHCFIKKSQQTPQRNIDIGKDRYKMLAKVLGK
jgi:phage-related protein